MNTPQRVARIALLIDADNSPAAKIDLILSELATLGVANVRRAYGNWKKDALRGWEKLLHEHAIRPMQQFDYSKGKNASDMAMVIDALELLYTDRPDAFGIVSSDADFTPLVMHLRAKGAAVYGFGNQQTPKPFVNACSQFLYLDKLAPQGEGGVAPQRMSPAQLRADAKLVALLRSAVQAAAGEEGWAMAGTVSQQIRNQTPFDARNYGFASFSRLLEATQMFELKREGSVAWVRDRRESRPAAPVAPVALVASVEPAASRAPAPAGRTRQAAAPVAEPAAAAAPMPEPMAAADAADPAPKRRTPRRKKAAQSDALAPPAQESAEAALPASPPSPTEAPTKPRTRRPRAKPAA